MDVNLNDPGKVTESQINLNSSQLNVKLHATYNQSMINFDLSPKGQLNKLSQRDSTQGTGILIPSTSLKAHKDLIGQHEGNHRESSIFHQVTDKGITDQVQKKLIIEHPSAFKVG